MATNGVTRENLVNSLLAQAQFPDIPIVVGIAKSLLGISVTRQREALLVDSASPIPLPENENAMTLIK
jgi:hypothetical protein